MKYVSIDRAQGLAEDLKDMVDEIRNANTWNEAKLYMQEAVELVDESGDIRDSIEEELDSYDSESDDEEDFEILSELHYILDDCTEDLYIELSNLDKKKGFNFVEAMQILKRTGHNNIFNWTMGAKDSLKLKDEIQKNAKKLPKKKFKLKEEHMNTEETLLESGIRIPKGTKAAKIIYHRDLDGVMSAILTRQQLIRQGIPEKNIRLSSIQYGTKDDEVSKMLSSSKGQMVAVVDFARFKEGMKKPDFWSDHHIQDEKVKINKQREEIVSRSSDADKISPDTEKVISDLEKKLKKNFSIDVFKKLVSELEKKNGEWGGKDKNNFILQTLFHGQFNWAENFISSLKNVAEAGKIVKNANINPYAKEQVLKAYRDTYRNIKKDETIKEPKVSKFSSDVAKWGKERRKKKALKEAVGKTEFPSEAEHLAKVHAKNLMTGKDIEAISRIDSANYSNLADVVNLPKNFKEKGRMERLAIITNALLTKLLKNEKAITQIIQSSSPSLVSVYNNTLKVSKMNNTQADIIDELSKEKPNWNKVEELRKTLPLDMAKDAVKGGNIQRVGDIKSIRKSRKENVKKHTTPEKTAFRKGNDYIIVQTTSGRGQPQRFLGSLLTSKNGERYPAMMREWATMLQISLNPDISKEEAKNINLTEIVGSVLDGLLRDIKSGKIKVNDVGMTKWAFNKVIIPEAGGHAGISTVGGLGTLGLAPKPTREEFKKIKAYSERANKIGKTLKDVMPKTAERYKELEAIKDEYAKERKLLVAELKKRILDEVEKKMKAANITKPKGSKQFMVKNPKKKTTMKESILHQLHYHT